MLDVYNEDTVIGTIDYGDRFLRLSYSESYLALPGAFAISASLPLSDLVIEDQRVDNFLWNLLPENPEFYQMVGHIYKIGDPDDPISVLSAIGQDTAGALSFYPHGVVPHHGGILERVGEKDIARDLAWLQSLSWSGANRISLAGVQPKTSYRRGSDGYWYRPSGTLASTHIFKPARPELHDVDLVELLVTLAAGGVGIDAVHAAVADFDSVRSFVTERYDRELLPDDSIRRLHQEDLMQMLGKPRRLKYQLEGGVGVVDLVNAVRSFDPRSETEIWRRLAFAVAIGNADAHGKNWSFLVDRSGHHLAPAYDLLSVEPFAHYDHSLAMQIGHQWAYKAVTTADWEYQASRTHTDPRTVRDAVEQVNDLLPTALNAARSAIDIDSPALDVVMKLVPTATIRTKGDIGAVITQRVAQRNKASNSPASEPPHHKLQR